MQNLESFLKDTKHTLQIIDEINEKIDGGVISLDGVGLVSLDVESMYNNMSNQLGTSACKEFLESRSFQTDGDDDMFVSTNSILTALDLCLKNNYFSFNDKVYQQVSGVGTGIKLAPTYACLGMGKYEKLVFNSNQDLLQKVLLWKRFIDDVLMLFKGNKQECEEFVGWLNSLMPGVVKFKFDFSFDKIEFLDLIISIENQKLKTNLFIKPTNKQLYLDFNSNHPLHCKESIPFSQALRVVERCATPEDRDVQLENLKTKLEERNYPPNLVDMQLARAKAKDRKSLIFQQRKQKKMKDDKVRFIFTHNHANPPIHKWVRESKQLLARNDKAKEMGKRIQIGSKQPRNLQRLVGGYKGEPTGPVDTLANAGCTKCNRCKVSCPILNQTKTFKSTNTSKIYPIRQKVDCNSDWVIYLATCKQCRGQYVGKSKNKFKTRHSGHKQEIKNNIGGLGHHYRERGGCGYDNISITIIEQVKEKNEECLADREVYWQHQLRVYVENGAGGHCYRKEIGK